MKKFTKPKILLLAGVLFILFFGGFVFAEKINTNDALSSVESIVYDNSLFNYAVNISADWIKIEDTGEYVAWLTPEANKQVVSGQDNTNGAKYAIAVLDNKENLSVDEWLLKYGGEEPAPLLQKENKTLKNSPSVKYIYGNFTGSSRGQHTNIYLPDNGRIFSFVVFPYDNDIVPNERNLYEIINSLVLRNK